MIDDVRFGVDQRRGVVDRDQHVAGRKVDDAAEPGDQMRGFQREAIEAEIGKAREGCCLRMPRKIASAVIGIAGDDGGPHQHHARVFERVALLALVEHQGYARVGEEIPGVYCQA